MTTNNSNIMDFKLKLNNLRREFMDVESMFKDYSLSIDKRKTEILDYYVKTESEVKLQLARINQDNFIKNSLEGNNNEIQNRNLNNLFDEIEYLEGKINKMGIKAAKVYNCNLKSSSCESRFSFNIFLMEERNKSKCSGCGQSIDLSHPFLYHNEPLGKTKKIVAFSYHIRADCLKKRGFSSNYLNRSNVYLKNDLMWLMDALKEIGFKNIEKDKRDRSPSVVLSDSESCVSQKSNFTSNEEGARFIYLITNKPRINVICHGCKQHYNQYIGDPFLQLKLGEQSDVGFKKGAGNIPKSAVKYFHIDKQCLQKYKSKLPKPISEIKCYTDKNLSEHSQLVALIGCGFYTKNIIGKKPNSDDKSRKYNPRNSQTAKKSTTMNKTNKKELPLSNPVTAVSNKVTTHLYRVNTEPFYCLPSSEFTCEGCHDPILITNVRMLQHYERIPNSTNLSGDRDGFILPLIPQYYHCVKRCLIKAGFTDEYLSGSVKIIAYVTLSDNRKNIENRLTQCGFKKIDFQLESDTRASDNSVNNVYNNNSHVSPVKSINPSGFMDDTCQNPMDSLKRTNRVNLKKLTHTTNQSNFKFYILSYSKSMQTEISYLKCAACKQYFANNQKCLVYNNCASFTKSKSSSEHNKLPIPIQPDSVVHFQENCVNHRFTREFMSQTTCIHDIKVDINPNDLMNYNFCIDSQNLEEEKAIYNSGYGVYTKKSQSFPSPTRSHVDSNFELKFPPPLFYPTQFHIELKSSNEICHGCKLPIQSNSIYLISHLRRNSTKPFHLNRQCLFDANVDLNQLAGIPVTINSQIDLSNNLKTLLLKIGFNENNFKQESICLLQ